MLTRRKVSPFSSMPLNRVSSVRAAKSLRNVFNYSKKPMKRISKKEYKRLMRVNGWKNRESILCSLPSSATHTFFKKSSLFAMPILKKNCSSI